MIEHSNEFFNNITSLGREIDVYIEYDETTVSSDNIYRLSFLFNTDLFKTIMTRVEIETDIELPMNTEMDFYFGVKVDEDYEYINKGTYKIVDQAVYNADTRTYTVMAYDNMVDTMIEYSSPILEFPATHKEFVGAIAESIGFTFTKDDYPNYNTNIESDIYEGLGLTYRDVLEDLVLAAGGNFIIKDDELKLIYPTETELELDEAHLNEVNVELGKHYGPVNSLVLSRVETDNIYRQDEESIEDNGLTEIKINDSPLLSTEYRNNFIQDLFDSINGLEYDIFDVITTGLGIFEPLDLVKFTVEDKEHKVLITNSEFTVSQGLTESIYNEIPNLTVTNYKVADTEDRVFRRAERLVDKQNLIITDVLKVQTEQETSISEIRQDMDGVIIEQKKQVKLTDEVSGKNFVELEGAREEVLLKGNILVRRDKTMYLFPSPNLYPSEDLYPNDSRYGEIYD